MVDKVNMMPTDGTTLPGEDFTKEMHEQARAEGWRLSERSDGLFGIEREDEAGKFSSDDDALIFVTDAALGGSYLHQLALHLDGTIIMQAYRVEMTLAATAYIKARGPTAAVAIAKAKVGDSIEAAEESGEEATFTGCDFDSPWLPDFSFSPAMTILTADDTAELGGT